MDKVKILAPAKINLHLQVTEKRSDGFHNLISLFQMVSLYDELLIEITDSGLITVDGNFDCPLEDNLIYKAAVSFKEKYGVDKGISVKCKKGIPPGGGLGGGSSDAAAVIISLNRLFNLNISSKELGELALELGSDVPFFLGKSTAVAMGRGEILSGIEYRNDLTVILVETSIHSSTAEAFRAITLNNKTEILTKEEIEYQFCKKNLSEWGFFNSFSSYLFLKYPVFKRMIDLLNSNGSEFSMVTGTGSSVFGLFTSSLEADKAYKALKKHNIRVHKLKMLANRPMAVYN